MIVCYLLLLNKNTISKKKTPPPSNFWSFCQKNMKGNFLWFNKNYGCHSVNKYSVCLFYSKKKIYLAQKLVKKFEQVQDSYCIYTLSSWLVLSNSTNVDCMENFILCRQFKRTIRTVVTQKRRKLRSKVRIKVKHVASCNLHKLGNNLSPR